MNLIHDNRNVRRSNSSTKIDTQREKYIRAYLLEQTSSSKLYSDSFVKYPRFVARQVIPHFRHNLTRNPEIGGLANQVVYLQYWQTNYSIWYSKNGQHY